MNDSILEEPRYRALGSLVSTKVLSQQWGIAEVTLRKWRAESKGPPYVKFGDSVRYPVAALNEWINARCRAA